MLPVAFLLTGAGAVFFLGLALIMLGMAIEKVGLFAFLKELKPLVDAVGWVLLIVYFAFQFFTAVQGGKWF